MHALQNTRLQPLGRSRVQFSARCIPRLHRQHFAVAVSASAETQVQEGVAGRTTVTLKMPTGLVFAQKEGGPVYVDEITAGGPADKSGCVSKGDVLSSCSAMVLKAGKEGAYEQNGHGEYLYDNWQRIMFECQGESFKSVMSALKSNNPRWGIKEVVMVFDKPQPVQQQQQQA